MRTIPSSSISRRRAGTLRTGSTIPILQTSGTIDATALIGLGKRSGVGQPSPSEPARAPDFSSVFTPPDRHSPTAASSVKSVGTHASTGAGALQSVPSSGKVVHHPQGHTHPQLTDAQPGRLPPAGLRHIFQP